MKINQSGASLSKIVQIGEKLKRLTVETGQQYLPLNRGVNAVVNIDLTEVIKCLDFNSPDIQVYPPGPGFQALREAINQEYFQGKSSAANILVTAGGMNALDLIVQTVNIGKLYLPIYYWGCYFHMLKVRNIGNAEYYAQSELYDRIDELKGNAVLICDPGNPLGEKYDDEEQFKLIKTLNDNGIIVFFDSPYRRIFNDKSDNYYARLMELENVVITESFSKSVGLSGQRLGFIHTTNKELFQELEIRLMYCTNGVNAFAQQLVLSLLTKPEGIQAATAFKTATARDIALNIDYLRRRELLAEEYYHTSTPKGIFVVVPKTEEELLEHNIGSVSLSFFTKSQKEKASKYARICVSAPHKKFVQYFDNIK
ncbi:MAG: pyridoxal phosphate-dependent aminotransferase [Rikenellaceae bacterium]